MAQGPPPSAAGPSQAAHDPTLPTSGPETHQQQHLAYARPNLHNRQIETILPSAYFSGYPAPWQYGPWQYPYNSGQAPPGSSNQPQPPHSGYPIQHTQPISWAPPVPATLPGPATKRKAASPSPSPPPPPPLPQDWDSVLKDFLATAGLMQALRGFELDMLVMNEDRQQSILPSALTALKAGLTVRALFDHIYF
jgi:hypothetical protein